MGYSIYFQGDSDLHITAKINFKNSQYDTSSPTLQSVILQCFLVIEDPISMGPCDLSQSHTIVPLGFLSHCIDLYFLFRKYTSLVAPHNLPFSRTSPLSFSGKNILF
jgi:hypothetical protein